MPPWTFVIQDSILPSLWVTGPDAESELARCHDLPASKAGDVQTGLWACMHPCSLCEGRDGAQRGCAAVGLRPAPSGNSRKALLL